MATKFDSPPLRPRHVRVVCISDTHELHRDIDLPPGDILIHAGDLTFFSKCASMLLGFDEWLAEQPHRTKIVIPGNHDFAIEAGKGHAIRNATLLINRGVESHRLRIWGSPITPLSSSAFGMVRSEDRRNIYSRIPTNTDILITHGPPLGILDGEPGSSQHNGCAELAEAVKNLKPKLHVFGHVHTGYGVARKDDTIFANAAMFTELGDVDRQPLEFDIPVDE